jgi:hypothetical protein
MSKMLKVYQFLKSAVPSVKPKKSLIIDSELVMWMKDEKEIKNIECWKDTEIFNLQAVKVL